MDQYQLANEFISAMDGRSLDDETIRDAFGLLPEESKAEVFRILTERGEARVRSIVESAQAGLERLA